MLKVRRLGVYPFISSHFPFCFSRTHFLSLSILSIGRRLYTGTLFTRAVGSHFLFRSYCLFYNWASIHFVLQPSLFSLLLLPVSWAAVLKVDSASKSLYLDAGSLNVNRTNSSGSGGGNIIINQLIINGRAGNFIDLAHLSSFQMQEAASHRRKIAPAAAAAKKATRAENTTRSRQSSPREGATSRSQLATTAGWTRSASPKMPSQCRRFPPPSRESRSSTLSVAS